MKKSLPLFLAVLFILPSISVAGDSYDATTGLVHMPIVSVGNENFEVDMLHQGDLVFKVTSATPTSTASTSPDTYNALTGVVHMPSVAVGSENFEVDMAHQGDLVFKVTSATPISTAIDLSGNWKGSASSTPYPQCGSQLNITMNQNGNTLTGSGTVSGSCVFGSGTLTAEINGSNISFGLAVGGGSEVNFIGTISDNHQNMSGTYNWPDEQDYGNWSLSLQ